MMQRLLQFTLDFFEPEPARPKARLKKPEKPEKLDFSDKKVPKAPLAQLNSAIPAIEIVANQLLPVAALTPQTLAQVLAPGTFRHPLANRESLLDGILVAYEFKRGKRRTIGFSIGPDGLAVRAPKWVALHDIDKAVLDKSAWILKKLQQSRERHHRLESARIEWRDGCTLPFLGEQVIVVLDPHQASGCVRAALKNNESTTLPGAAYHALHVGLPLSATADQIQKAVQVWLMQQAKQIFIERLNHFAPTLRVQWLKLSLSSASTRWGSASSDGSIRLNWRLIHFRQAVIDYVVVHELSHLRVMNHSPQFWDTVRAVVPDYAELRRQLKDEGTPRW